jgi:hypothetical protein
MEEITTEKIKERIQGHLRTCEDRSFSDYSQIATDANDLLGHLLSLKNNDLFLRNTYEVVLSRSPDDSGYAHYMNRLNIGIPKLLILYQIINSKEARYKKIYIKLSPGSILRFMIALLEDRLINWGLKNKHWIKKIPLVEHNAQFFYRKILAHRISTRKR